MATLSLHEQLAEHIVWLLVQFVAFSILTFALWRRLGRKSRIALGEHEWILITGCDSGIGFALSDRLARSGYKVIATCLHPSGPSARALISHGVEVFRLDLMEKDLEVFGGEVENFLKKNSGRLHALVNNAGVCVMGEFDWLTEQQVDLVFKVNLGSMRVIRLLMDRIVADRCRIINVTSVNGIIAYPGLSAYCASKSALESFSDSLAMELEKFGVRVIKVRPADFAKITSIMSAQDEHTERMRQNLSESKRLRYGNYFDDYQRLTSEMAGQLSMENFDGILKIFEDALFEAEPRIAYNSGHRFYILVCRLLCVLPECCQRFVVTWAFRKVLREQNVALPNEMLCPRR
ncbi:retinol dehydrogenase 5-like [Galendromus occidentalis]|uniref:Retinol dehydrogenase 5-like n=1 Tax=Galendromus occidentalis TaxID=34638 RepID=A0AAJ6VYE4_9ACAR|nr:retinol dehydrogenase 5-like [Galendromus occidentalis]